VATQVVQEEKQFDLIVRLERQYRDNPEEIGNILVATPAGQQIPLKEFADIQVANGASFIYRQDNSRYIGVQFSVEGRDLAGAVDDAMQQVKDKVALPQGYRLDWGGEYTEYTASRRQLNVILPLTLFLIFLLLFALYSNFKFPFITVLGVVLSAPVGGIVALWITGTPFSVSSGIGFLALFGVSVQTAVVYISYVNEHRFAYRYSTRRDSAVASDHDDRAGGGVGLVAGGAGHRCRHGFTTAVCPGHCQRPVHATFNQHFSHAGALCPGGPFRRSAGSVMKEAARR
jgi:Cu/Ag efflux pump CusA